ncbi:MAG: hypothetical protein WBK55_06285 [Alphaproteobacteria bacterium]
MWYNRSGSLIQTESLHPVVENLGTAFIIALSIYAAVPAPQHDENKFALEESAAVTTVAYNPDAKAGETVHEPRHGGPDNQKIREILHAAGRPSDQKSIQQMKALSRRGEMNCASRGSAEDEVCRQIHDLLYPEPAQP